MLIAPQAYCGSHDTECATIVRIAIGLPAIAGGVGVGALVDGLMSRGDNSSGFPAGAASRKGGLPLRSAGAKAGLQINWKF
jgi:hypothetical protein